MFRTWTTSALVTGRILNLVRLFWYCMFKWNSLVSVSGPYTPALDTLLFTPTIVIIHTSVGHTVNYNYHCNNTHNIYTPLTWSQTTQSIPSANYLQQFYLILKKKQKKNSTGISLEIYFQFTTWRCYQQSLTVVYKQAKRRDTLQCLILTELC